jgi:hypothetical protein
MKIFNVIVSLSFCFVGFSQVDCESYRTGKFVVKSEEYGDSYITRTKDYQIEEAISPINGKKIKIKDKIVWVNDCSYQLFPYKLKDSSKLITDNVLTFRIVETAADYYLVYVSGLGKMHDITVKVNRQ